MELALAADVDEAGGFEFLDVVREGGGGDGQCGACLRAAQGTTGFGDALEQLEAARVGEGLEDGGAAGASSDRIGFVAGDATKTWRDDFAVNLATPTFDAIVTQPMMSVRR